MTHMYLQATGPNLWAKPRPELNIVGPEKMLNRQTDIQKNAQTDRLALYRYLSSETDLRTGKKVCFFYICPNCAGYQS